MEDIFNFLSGLDVGLLRFINLTASNSAFDIIFPAITDLHKTFGFKYIFIPLLAFTWIKIYKYRGAFVILFLQMSLSISDFIGGKIKRLALRPRPFEDIGDLIQRSGAGGYSFPSNHSLNMACTAIFLSFFFPRYRWAFYFTAFIVIYSRIYNGVHYPSDTLGGILIGVILGYIGAKLCHLTIRKFESYKESRSNV